MLTKLFDTVMADPSIAPHVDFIQDFTEPLGLFLGIALAALLLALGFFGQRMFGFVRWALVFVVGFFAGAGWLAPALQKFAPALDALIVGVAAGLILAVLSRFIYNVVFVAVIGFDVFNICYNALFFPGLEAMTKENLPISIAIALVCVFIALVLRKYLEMIITSGIGGIALAFAIKSFLFDFTAFLPLAPVTSAVILGAVLAVVMLIYQYRNRIRF